MQTEARATNYTREAGNVPIPGYRLIEPLGKGGFGEVWKCEAPGGLFKALKFVYGANENDLLDMAQSGAQQELRALQHIKSLRHPFLLSMDRLEWVDGELLIVMELADKSLHDLWEEYQELGENGIPRLDLLMYLREAAEVLDVMNLEHGLQHLDIKPRNLFLVSDHMKVADFGLVSSLADLAGEEGSSSQLAAITPIYASPESFLGKITLYSDQYSLGIVYTELLTGKLPFNGTNFRQLALQHNQAEPDLTMLPEGDRPFVARALAKEPRERFPSSTDFIRSLITGQMQAPQEEVGETSPVQQSRSVTVHEFEVPKEQEVPELRSKKTRSIQDIQIMDQARAKQSGSHASVVRRIPPAAVPTTHVNLPCDSQVDLGAMPQGSSPSQSAVGFSRGDGFFGPAAGAPAWPTDLSHYRFVDCLGRSPLGEMWKTELSDGRPCLLKMVNTFTESGMFGEENPVQRLQSIRHPLLQPVAIIPRDQGGITIVSDPISAPLAVELKRHPSGMPRADLLGHLLDAAEALDELARAYQIQHLGLNPRTTLLLGEEGLQIADFGLVALFWLPGGQPVAQMNARYSAPELFRETATRYCDQYSLALIYYEMLTGSHPFGSMSQRQMMQIRSTGKFDFDLLPASDRPILTRALHPEPGKRFRSCTEMIEALAASQPGGKQLLGSGNDSSLVTDEKPESIQSLFSELDSDEIKDTIRALVKAAAGDIQVRESGDIRYTIQPGRYLEHQCYARLVPSTIPIKLSGFREEWSAEAVSQSEGSFIFRARLRTSFWQKCMGSAPCVEVCVEVLPPASHATMTDVHILIRPQHCNEEQAVQALDDLGAEMLASIRNHLQAGPERRADTRFAFNVPVQFRPVLADQSLGEAMVCQGKDISRRGIGLYLPCKPPPGYLVLQLQPTASSAVVSVPAQIMHSHLMEDGRYEVGLKFIRR